METNRALVTQTNTFEQTEANLSADMSSTGINYYENSLKPNPEKNTILRNRSANCALNISWRGTPITDCSHSKYLGITLERSLTFKVNCEKIKQTNTRARCGSNQSRCSSERNVPENNWMSEADAGRDAIPGPQFCYFMFTPSHCHTDI
ncbi:unnamed protein product [Arctia plantaginis]|uniref:Uncharacterized protein n=1 Tax=Arctia plantaginis TaxID=874455 RepID=A0A8S0Z4K1_ARCPL|nr:unnamed protein product [Arctia plantaginis]